MKRGHAKFCSVACASKRKRPELQSRVKLICAMCGKEFERTPSKNKNATHGISFFSIGTVFSLIE